MATSSLASAALCCLPVQTKRELTSAAIYVAANYAEWGVDGKCSLTGSQQHVRLGQSGQQAYFAANASDFVLARLCTDVIWSDRTVHVHVTAACWFVAFQLASDETLIATSCQTKLFRYLCSLATSSCSSAILAAPDSAACSQHLACLSLLSSCCLTSWSCSTAWRRRWASSHRECCKALYAGDPCRGAAGLVSLDER